MSHSRADRAAADEPAIDRIAPTLPPRRAFVMHQRWYRLLFLHWPCDPATIQPHLPPGLEVDTFGGQAYIGLVPFSMSGVRPRFLPAVPWLSNFHEVNVRTYVHHAGRDPGVWFFSLDAARLLAVWAARAGFHLPYFHAAIDVDARLGGDNETFVEYHSRRRGARGAVLSVVYRALGRPAAAVPGTLEHFLIERYILYAHSRGRLYLGRVHHAPYPVQSAEVLDLDESLLSASGLARPTRPPLAHIASGVNVRVYPLERAPS